MENNTVDDKNKNPAEQTQGGLAAFRHVGLPLLQALVEVGATQNGITETLNANDGAQKMETLVGAAVALSQKLATELGAAESALGASVRWALAGAASQVVAAYYQATGTPLSSEDMDQLALIAVTLQNRFKDQIPASREAAPDMAATFRAKMMEGMVPVVGAVAQYAFGRAEHELLAEVAERLVKTADQVTRALAAPGSSPEQWRLLCWTVLRAAGQIYAESHYAEADRLNAMEPEQQQAYFAAHQTVPMTQVWQAFNQRMAMLATLATYLDVPETAHLERQGWSS